MIEIVKIAAIPIKLVTALRVSISLLNEAEFAAINTYCKVRIDIIASINLMVRIWGGKIGFYFSCFAYSLLSLT